MVMVRAGGSDSNKEIGFQLENRLTNATFQTVNDKVRVTLTGTSLGNDPGGFLRSTYYEHVTLGGSWIPYASVISWSNNTIVFDVPVSTPPGSIMVTSNGYDSNTLAYNPFGNVFLPLTQK